MRSTLQLLLAVSFLLLASACGDDGNGPVTGATFVPRLLALHAEPDPADGGRIVDAEGRHVLLRGVNVTGRANGGAWSLLARRKP